MKKALSILLSLVLILGCFSAGFGINATAASYEQIGANQTWRNSWNGSTRYVYLKVNQTGYYDLTITDYEQEAGVKFYLTDMDFESSDESWYNTSWSVNSYIDTYSRENLYLIQNHLYQIEISYGDYDDYDDFINFYADLSFVFTETNYTPTQITLGSTTNMFIGYDTYEWVEFKTSASGDYLFTLNDYADFNLNIFEKASGKYIKFTYFDYYKTTRLRLKANTEYIIMTSSGEYSDKLVRLKISKADQSISKIDIANSVLILADDGYFYSNGEPSLYNSDISSFNYKVTYSNQTTQTFTYEGLREFGVTIDDITYSGPIYTYGEESFFKLGNQPVTIHYMGTQKSSTYISVTSYLDWCSNLSANSDFDDMVIEYEDDDVHTYYWKIRPDETNVYSFYSSYWDELGYLNRTIFDKNNNIVPANDSSWCLKGGQEYVLRVTYYYDDYCYSDVPFWLEPYREHNHNRVLKTVQQATLTRNGRADYICNTCGNVGSSKTIFSPKTFKLSATSYTYDGKDKKPTIKVYDSAGNLISSSYYTVSYKNNKNVGIATATVTFKGNYSGTKTLNFTINPKKTSVSKLTAAKKSLKISVKKQSGITGYEVQYSTSKKFSGAKTKTIKSYKTTSVTLKSLKAKKTYYVRVRTYKTVKGKKYYSGWSSAKSKKTK